LNPHFSQGTKDSSAAHPVLEPLADFDKDGNLVPVLAAEIPTLDNGGVSSDAKTVTWKLKQGVKWSDGQPFTADDVVFTWQYIVDPKANTTTVASYKPIDKVEAVDQYTVRITFKEPNPAWANVFTTGFGGQILPKHILQNSMGEKAANDPYNLKPIGTGPYKIEEFRPGDVVVYTMNENFREPDKPFFKRLELKGGGDATSAARAAVQTGDTDFAWNLQVEEQVLKSLETAGGPGVIEVIPGPDVERILVNMTDPNKEVDGERSSLKAPHPFQSDLEVRKAYALLCDRDAIAAIYGRAGKPTANVQTMPPRSASKNTSWKFDVEAAKKQLDSAGWAMQGNVRAKNGVQMKILYQTTVNSVRQKTQEIVKKAFEQAGIQVELKSIDSKVFFDSSPGNPDTAAHFYADIEMFTNSSSSPYPIDYMASWWGDPSNIA
ncbi:MAG: peptide ABC transporter substrate-binding protein, partial [Thermomicrobiaceae bacterium]|nr:peptide ABC transporter substrate-binding protein [Thermomicrobiaceae bacterium]